MGGRAIARFPRGDKQGGENNAHSPAESVNRIQTALIRHVFKSGPDLSPCSLRSLTYSDLPPTPLPHASIPMDKEDKEQPARQMSPSELYRKVGTQSIFTSSYYEGFFQHTKPQMERKRRERINRSLAELKTILLSVIRQEGIQVSRGISGHFLHYSKCSVISVIGD